MRGPAPLAGETTRDGSMSDQGRCKGRTIEIAVSSEMKRAKAYVIAARSFERAEDANGKANALKR